MLKRIAVSNPSSQSCPALALSKWAIPSMWLKDPSSEREYHPWQTMIMKMAHNVCGDDAVPGCIRVARNEVNALPYLTMESTVCLPVRSPPSPATNASAALSKTSDVPNRAGTPTNHSPKQDRSYLGSVICKTEMKESVRCVISLSGE